jgi:L-fucose mutarotase
MLKKIPAVISPQLMLALMEMGHGDELVIADANFPAVSHARLLIQSDQRIPVLLDAIMQFFPLDTFVANSVFLMKTVKGDNYKSTIQDEYQKIILSHEPAWKAFARIERSAFYARAKEAFAIVATAETERYANLILKKGIVG